MGEERDAHGQAVSQAAERARVEGVYAGYAADPRKQRAWSAANPGNQAIRAELVAAVLPLVPSAGVILDVGCGTGWWLAALADHGVPPARLAGVELQEARVVTAQARLPEGDVRCGDATQLPFADGEVAMVTLFTVLSSLGSDDLRRLTLREARRVVRRGGVIAVWEPRVPTGNPRTARVRRRLLREELGRGLHVRSLTLMPPLARRVPSARAYRALARVPVLRTHRLVVART
jgi:ubiquinone/menaquinone biosynthesis C-methylase UbiE